jgi:hypothetical protein
MGFSNRRLGHGPRQRFTERDPNELVKCHYLGYIVVKPESGKSLGLGSVSGGTVEHWVPTKNLGQFHYIKVGCAPADKLMGVRFDWFEAPRWWARKCGFILGSE